MITLTIIICICLSLSQIIIVKSKNLIKIVMFISYKFTNEKPFIFKDIFVNYLIKNIKINIIV